jgi:K+-sensing histidine kinase KdpD
MITIQDNGIPIDIDDNNINNHKSTGLNLVMVRAMISNMGGDLSIKFSRNTAITSIILELDIPHITLDSGL